MSPPMTFSTVMVGFSSLWNENKPPKLAVAGRLVFLLGRETEGAEGADGVEG